jgi:AraC-like DNA-binding protein
MRHCGMDVSPGEIIVDNWQSMHRRTFASCQWSSMSLSPEDLAAAGQAIAGRPLAAPTATHVVRPEATTMAQLLNPLEQAVRLAETTPEKLSNPEVVRGLEQTLIHAMVSCLTAGTVKGMSDGDRRHLAAIDRLEQFLEANHDRPLYIAEVCAACGVSERTLRASCQDHLGMSPVRYLWLRRMHLAQRMLIKADPTKTTVTEIATEHGFWELGRFSVQYRALFGELPSVTLRSAQNDRAPAANRPSALPIPNLHSRRH